MGHTRASLALKRWLLKTGTSQVDFAALVTRAMADAGVSLEKPVNQSTVSSWSRGKHPPGAHFMIVIDRLTGIPVDDWLTREAVADDSGELEAIADTDEDAA